MRESYAFAKGQIAGAIAENGKCLDCGAYNGYMFRQLNELIALDTQRYVGIEWNEDVAREGRDSGLCVVHGDLNERLDFPNNEFKCVFGLSVLEHLLYPCSHLKECYRVLDQDGSLIILTPNISTYFTALLILMGKMPSSGPHPDSEALLEKEELFRVSNNKLREHSDSDTPGHRHIVVFSYRVLLSYLHALGFRRVTGYGFGLYPFPNFLQPFVEKIDPYHCHQMVLIAKK